MVSKTPLRRPLRAPRKSAADKSKGAAPKQVHCDLSLIIETMPIAALQADARNARRHGPKQIEHLKAVIARMGFVQPVLIDHANTIIAGHGRVEAMRQLGRTHVPAIRLSHLSPTEARALALADNRLAELSEWDEATLKLEFGELLAEDLDFSLPDLTGFAAPVIDVLVHGGDFAKVDPADDPSAGGDLGGDAVGPAITRPGDLFAIGPHRLVCGDARDADALSRLLDGEIAAQVLADGPYNVRVDGNVANISGKGPVRHREFLMGAGEMSREDFAAFNRDWLAAAARVCADGALIYAFMDGLHLCELVEGARAAQLTHIAQCVWAKTNTGMGSLYRSQVEFVAVFKSGAGKHTNNIQLGRFGRNRSNLWSYPGMNTFSADRKAALATHPSVKPVGLLSDVILDASRRGEIILDPFLGSGSTIIAADRTGRRGYGVELDPLYVDAALDRCAGVLQIDPVRVADGAAWSALHTPGEHPASEHSNRKRGKRP